MAAVGREPPVTSHLISNEELHQFSCPCNILCLARVRGLFPQGLHIYKTFSAICKSQVEILTSVTKLYLMIHRWCLWGNACSISTLSVAENQRSLSKALCKIHPLADNNWNIPLNHTIFKRAHRFEDRNYLVNLRCPKMVLDFCSYSVLQWTALLCKMLLACRQ